MAVTFNRMPDSRQVTQLLGNWRSGDAAALDELTPLVYDELRRLAKRYIRKERDGHTLQTTGLVNEAFIRLAGSDVAWQDRAHFFAVAARIMRRILIDYAKARRAEKRGGDVHQTVLDESAVAGSVENADILALDEALQHLAEIDSTKSDIVVLHYFGGMTYDEIGEAVGVSAATVDRHLRLGKAWLHNELSNA